MMIRSVLTLVLLAAITSAATAQQKFVELVQDGKPFQGNKGENILVQVLPGELVESRIPALEGVKVGDVKAIEYAFPADYGVEEVKGKTAKFSITLKAIKQEVVPELNDEFAKDAGFDSLKELKDEIRQRLLRQREEAAESEVEEKAIEAALDRVKFDLRATSWSRSSTSSR